MSLRYLFYSQQQRNSFWSEIADEYPISRVPKYDVEIYLNNMKQIVPVTQVTKTSDAPNAFDGCYLMGSTKGNNATRLVDHYEVTKLGKKVAQEMGIPATYEAFYGLAIKNMPQQELSPMAKKVSETLFALTHDR